jgi:hypothetical protein
VIVGSALVGTLLDAAGETAALEQLTGQLAVGVRGATV